MGASVTEARPVLELGEESPGGLRLPDAKPSRRALYAPRGVAFLPGGGLAVADTGNHRVLLWRSAPAASRTPADVVLGQVDFDLEGAQSDGRGPESGMHLPCGLLFAEGRLFVCDAWNHRILVWDGVPTQSGSRPDHVVGQAGPDGVEKNRGGAIGPSGLDCPYGIAVVDGDLHVADTQNRRVLVWDGLPDGDVAAARVLGQPDFTSGEENRGRGPGPDTFRWPHAIAGTDGGLLVADAGNHRLLGWTRDADRTGPADVLVGQPDFETAFEMPHVPQGPGRLRFPYGLVADSGRVLVADTANNRVLGFPGPLAAKGAEADLVLGQPNFDKAGENRWSAIAPDTLCWPYGLALDGERLAVADSGNNRVVLWHLSPTA